jgi:hypothetical protein
LGEASGSGDSDPRLIEQPQSAISATTVNARGPSREAPEKAWETGQAISAEHSRAYTALVAWCVVNCIGQHNNAGTKARVIAIKSADG